jgi:polysaccharide deacetylase family sporulation protein PdaB
MIALTFDDGPDKKNTEEILDILKEYNIKATFFVIGKNCEENPEILKRIASEGHEIGNHTYSHPHLSKMQKSKVENEIRRTEEIVNEITGHKTCLFRPPEGVYSPIVAQACDTLGYKAILWSVDTTDWRSPKADKIVREVVDKTSSGSIILCHDYIAGESNTPAALRTFIPQLIQQGYNFVTVSELISP